MSAYRFIVDQLDLKQPTLVVALVGWIDSSGSAAAAMGVLEAECNAEPIAVFDGDMFIDYRARRPTMELRDGVNTRLVWPNIELKAGRDSAGHDVLMLTGPEPDMAWRRFGQEVTELSLRLGVQRMVGLGAYPYAAPHTRDPRLTVTSPSADIVAQSTLRRSSIDVPAGAAAMLEHALNDGGIDTLGLWVQVPHYVSSMAYPAATVALLCGLTEHAGIAVDGSAARRETIIQRQRLDELVSANDEHRLMVDQLEVAYDAEEAEVTDGTAIGSAAPPLIASELPSAEELGAELERFLREQEF